MHFFRYKPLKLTMLFWIALVLGFSQGITIVLLIPLLSLLDPSKSGEINNKWAELVNSLLQFTGIQINLPIVLIVFIASLLLIAFLTFLQSIMQAAYQQEFSYHTRKRLFRKIINCDWSFLSGKSKHNHIQILTSEIPKMTIYYYYYLSLAIKVIFIFAHVVVAFFLSASFTLLVLLIGLLVFILLRKNLQEAALLGFGNINAFRKMLKQIDDFWTTVKLAKVHGTEKFYSDKFDETNQFLLEQQFRQLKNRALPQLIFTIAGVVTLVLLVYVAIVIIELPMTSLFVLILLFSRIFPQLASINSDLNILVSNVESVKMVLATDNDIPEQPTNMPINNDQLEIVNQIEIRNLTFGYNPKKPLFSDLSVSIPAMKITGIIGKSGRGKTTLLDILTGLQKTPTSSIFIDNFPLTDENLRAWQNTLGYLPQDSMFVDGTIRENLVWDSSQEVSNEHIFKCLTLVRGEKLVSSQKQGLDTHIVNYQYHFSGGERQRLALARILIRNPRFLLLDEATSALDPESEKQIMECLAQLKSNVTIVVVTHRRYLKPYFDWIIDLDMLKSM